MKKTIEHTGQEPALMKLETGRNYFGIRLRNKNLKQLDTLKKHPNPTWIVDIFTSDHDVQFEIASLILGKQKTVMFQGWIELSQHILSIFFLFFDGRTKTEERGEITCTKGVLFLFSAPERQQFL